MELAKNRLRDRENEPAETGIIVIRQKPDRRSVYYFMKAKTVTSDSVFMYTSHLRNTKPKWRMKKEDYFEKSKLIPISRTDLKKMLEEEEITSIKRNYPASSQYNAEQ